MKQQKAPKTGQGGPRRHSLKWSMIGMVLFCWILPVLLIVAGAGVYIFNSLATQAQKNLQMSAETAAELVTTRMDAAMASSRKASYIPTIRDAWQSYQQTGEAVELYENVNLFLYQQYKYDEKFLNVMVTFLQDPTLSFYTTNVTAGGTMQGVRSYRETLEASLLARSATLGTSTAFVVEKGHVYLVRNLVDSAYQPYAVLAMELNSRLLFREMADLPGAGTSTLWLGGTPVPLVQGGPTLTPPAGSASGVKTTGQADGFVVGAQAARASYQLQWAAFVQPVGLRSQQGVALLALAAIFVLLLPMMGFVLRFFARKVTRPVDALIAAAGQIELGSFGVQVEQTALTSSEMGTLGDSFNSMSNTLLNQFEHIYKEELALRDARIMALQSQINPHFLNNTLEIINWEARMNGNLKVCRMLESLSTMLEAAMDRRHRPLVHLSEELMYADAYLYIIGERLGKRLTVQKQIDPELLDVMVPRLVLQPIMENAVEHGINPTQQGTITLRARRQGHWLLLEVENDGTMTQDDLARIRALLSDAPAQEGERSVSLGIRNVHQRLRILYGEESGLFVTITKKGNTLCSIKIDLDQGGQEYTIKTNLNH